MANKKKPGPPVKQLDHARAESVAAMGGTNEQIAAALGVSLGTLKNARNRDVGLDDAIRTGKDKADLRVVQSLYQKAINGDTTAMIFWLKNRRPTEWRDKRDFEHTGEGGGPVRVQVERVVTTDPKNAGIREGD
jgi:hypothetical protein